VVLAIIGIITTVSVSALVGVNSALNLSTAAQTIMSEITLARQTALTYSETVEVRFYYYTDSHTNTSQYQAVQTYSTTDGTNFTQLDKISYLPTNIMIDQTTKAASTALSYPFGEASATLNPTYTPNTTTGAAPIPGTIGLGYTYKSLRFKIDGSVDYVPGTSPWPPSTWFITLYEKKYASTPSSAKNFITVSVDSTNGRVRMFQP